MRVLTDNIGFLVGGMLKTLELTVLGFVGALLAGTFLAVCRVAPIAPLRLFGAQIGNLQAALLILALGVQAGIDALPGQPVQLVAQG